MMLHLLLIMSYERWLDREGNALKLTTVSNENSKRLKVRIWFGNNEIYYTWTFVIIIYFLFLILGPFKT